MRCYRAHKQTIKDAEPARTQQALHAAEAQLYLSARQLWPTSSQKVHYQTVLHTSKAAEFKTHNKEACTGQCTGTRNMEVKDREVIAAKECTPLQTARRTSQAVMPCSCTTDVSQRMMSTGAMNTRFSNPMKPKKVVTSACSSFGSIWRIAMVYEAYNRDDSRHSMSPTKLCRPSLCEPSLNVTITTPESHIA